MATYTENYSLAKPEKKDDADINVLNKNTDVIDELMHDLYVNSANAYDETSTYKQGNLVIYEQVLYKALVDIEVAEPFDDTKWAKTSLGLEIMTRIKVVVLTQVEYDALSDDEKNADVLYVIEEA